MSKTEIMNMEYSEIINKINNVRINTKKKEDFGEVPTPIQLIEEMLNRLPTTVWRDPHKRWLDPATGIGSFQMIVYERLMKGLSSWESSVTKRHHHIIKNMLFMCEINSSSITQVKKVFGSHVNISGDFLKHDFKDSFDIILGNPPFNEAQETGSGKRSTGNTIWIDFVEKSLDILSKNGYLLFVHPPGWRKPTTESSKTDGLYKKMALDHQIVYLEIHNKSDGVNTFGVQTRYDWYLLSNRPCYKKTVVKDEFSIIHSIDLREWQFLPNSEYSLIKRILCSKNDPPVDIIYSRTQYATDMEWVNETKTDAYKYPLIHSTPKKSEIRMFWTSTKEPPIRSEIIPMYDIPKVIFGEAGINTAILDNGGKYGLTQCAMAIPIKSKKEGIAIKLALESSIFERIINAMSFGNFRIDWRIFLFFKRDFYKYFGKMKHEKTQKLIKKKKRSVSRKIRKHSLE